VKIDIGLAKANDAEKSRFAAGTSCRTGLAGNGLILTPQDVWNDIP
jgi:hypothetical protein